MKNTPVSETLLSCTVCSATIYPEHMDRHQAGYWSGLLLCSICLEEKKKNEGGKAPLTDRPAADGRAPAESAAPAPTRQTPDPAGQARILHPSVRGATRIRTFHARLCGEAVDQLDAQVNAWLDRHPDIEVKFANTTVGSWEGRPDESSLILTLFY